MPLNRNKLSGLILILLAIGSYASLQIGHVEIDLFAAIISPLYGNTNPDTIILWHLRMPRTLMCLIVGFGLGIAGAGLQGFLRNPLAEPSVVGISSAAALGAVLSIGLGFSALGLYYTPAFSLGFAAIASWALIKLTSKAASNIASFLSALAFPPYLALLQPLCSAFRKTPLPLMRLFSGCWGR